MSYTQARACFTDILRYVTPADNPAQFNLANGLDSLATATEADMHEIKALLGQIVTVLNRIARHTGS